MKISLYPLYKVISDLTIPYRIDKGVWIVKNIIDKNKINTSTASAIDIIHLQESTLCLSIDEDIIKPERASIMFMISCRLLKQTQIFIRYRVHSSKELLRIKDDYPYILDQDTTMQINQSEFNRIAELYIGLKEFESLNKRTGNAIYLLSLAYRSRECLEALIFHVCTLETLTSASEIENKITDKFKNRIHNFTGNDINELEKIYNVRSELVHGRYNSKSKKKNLELNMIAEKTCREVFNKILLNSEYIRAFVNDSSRMKLFQNYK